MDHLQRTRDEFAKQADQFSLSPAISDEAQVARITAALGDLRGCRVLDVACGTGIVTSALARSAMEVVGIDLTPEMLKKAEERCAGLGLSNVRFLE